MTARAVEFDGGEVNFFVDFLYNSRILCFILHRFTSDKENNRFDEDTVGKWLFSGMWCCEASGNRENKTYKTIQSPPRLQDKELKACLKPLVEYLPIPQ